jgi:Xaa-Pro aminopeptidase
MIVTNEPVYYLTNSLGIRIVNMLLFKEKDSLISFENLTIVPYESNLICMRLISDQFLEFIDDTHKEC